MLVGVPKVSTFSELVRLTARGGDWKNVSKTPPKMKISQRKYNRNVKVEMHERK